MNLRKTALLLALVTLCSLLFTACSEENLNPDDGWYPAGYQLASNENMDYTLFVPETWNVDLSTGVLSASTVGGNITMVGTTVEDGTTLASFWEKYETQFDPAFENFTYVTEGEDMLLSGGKVAAKKYVYTAKVTGTEYRFQQVIAIVNQTAYIFTFTAMAEKYGELAESVEGILSYLSFKSVSSAQTEAKDSAQ